MDENGLNKLLENFEKEINNMSKEELNNFCDELGLVDKKDDGNTYLSYEDLSSEENNHNKTK